MKVLGIDPGYGRVGWAVVEGSRSRHQLAAVGCLETSPTDPLEVRLGEIYEFMMELIGKYKPEAVAVEELYFFKNQKTVMGVGQARGVIVLSVVRNKLPCFHYTPLQVKNTVTGYGKASKEQVQMMVKSQLKLKAVPKPDDAADAAAVALTHMFMSTGV